MTRVLLVINSLVDHGGAEVSTIGLLDALQGNRCTFHVATLNGEATTTLRPELESRGASFSALRGRFPHQMRQLLAAIDAFQPDVIHGTLFEAETLAVLAARKRRVPSLVSLVNMQYDPAATAVAPSPRKLEVARRLESNIVRRATHVHALTQAVADHGAAYLGVDPTRVSIVPRGRSSVELGRRSSDRRQAKRHELGLGETTPVLLHVARQEPQKGHDLLLDAMTKITAERSDAQLLLAGRDGNSTAQIADQIAAKNLGSNVRTLGTRSDVADLHCAADVFCFPSRYEGLGGSVVEAMALETPIVSFGIDVIGEVTGGHAHLVDPFDVDGLATAVLDVLRTPGPDPHVRAARDRFETTFTIEASAAEMADLYRRVAAGPVPRTLPPRWPHGPERAWSLARAAADANLADTLNAVAVEHGRYDWSHDWLAAWWLHRADQPAGTAHAWYHDRTLVGFAAVARFDSARPLIKSQWQAVGRGLDSPTLWGHSVEVRSEIADWLIHTTEGAALEIDALDESSADLVPIGADSRPAEFRWSLELDDRAEDTEHQRARRRTLERFEIEVDVTPAGQVREADLHDAARLDAHLGNPLTDSDLALVAELAHRATPDRGPVLVRARRRGTTIGALLAYRAGSTLAIERDLRALHADVGGPDALFDALLAYGRANDVQTVTGLGDGPAGATKTRRQAWTRPRRP